MIITSVIGYRVTELLCSHVVFHGKCQHYHGKVCCYNYLHDHMHGQPSRCLHVVVSFAFIHVTTFLLQLLIDVDKLLWVTVLANSHHADTLIRCLQDVVVIQP